MVEQPTLEVCSGKKRIDLNDYLAPSGFTLFWGTEREIRQVFPQQDWPCSLENRSSGQSASMPIRVALGMGLILTRTYLFHRSISLSRSRQALVFEDVPAVIGHIATILETDPRELFIGSREDKYSFAEAAQQVKNNLRNGWTRFYWNGHLLTPDNLDFFLAEKPEQVSLSVIVDAVDDSGELDEVFSQSVGQAFLLGKGELCLLEKSTGGLLIIRERVGLVKSQTEAGGPTWISEAAFCEACQQETEFFIPEAKRRLAGPERSLFQRSCLECGGLGLSREILALTLGGVTLGQLLNSTIVELWEWCRFVLTKESPSWPGSQEEIDEIIKLEAMLGDLVTLGLGYLNVGENLSSLNRREFSGLSLVCDQGKFLLGPAIWFDPTLGIYPQELEKLLNGLQTFSAKGPYLVVSKDARLLGSVSRILENQNGRLVVGELPAIKERKRSEVGYSLPLPASSATSPPILNSSAEALGSESTLFIENASLNNLRDVSLHLPLQSFVVVSGPTGSGKESLVSCVIKEAPLKVISLSVHRGKKKQGGSVLGYSGLLPIVQQLYAILPQAKVWGLKPRDFRYMLTPEKVSREAMSVQYRGHNICQVAEMSVGEAAVFFCRVPKLKRLLEAMVAVSLGELFFGCSLSSLSQGEIQRLRLYRYLVRARGLGADLSNSLFLGNYLSSGLADNQVMELGKAVCELCHKGASFIAIDNHPGIWGSADYILQLGPGGGRDGGEMLKSGHVIRNVV